MALRVSEEEYAKLKGASHADADKAKAGSAPKRLKYNNKIVVVDGRRFHSIAEAKRYSELKLLEQAGKIKHLHLQVQMPCDVNGKSICKYVADFAYIENGKGVVEDVKGVATPVYRLKKKLVEALYGLRIKEVRKR